MKKRRYFDKKERYFGNKKEKGERFFLIML